MKKLSANEKKFLVKFNLLCAPLIYKIYTDLPIAETSDALIAKGLFFGSCLLAPTVFALSMIYAMRLISFTLSSLTNKAINFYFKRKPQPTKKTSIVKTTTISRHTCEVIQFPTSKTSH